MANIYDYDSRDILAGVLNCGVLDVDFIVRKINISFLYQSSVMVVSEIAFRFFLIRERLFCRQIDNHRQLNMRF